MPFEEYNAYKDKFNRFK
jgi:hypothetical protein